MESIYINAPGVGERDKKEILKSQKANEGISVEFLYDSNFGSAKILRDFVEALCDVIGLENKRKSRLILITDELNNNAIEYGSKEGEINSMKLIVRKTLSSYEINVEIEDTGNGTAPKSAQEMDLLQKERLTVGFKNHDSIRGRGLFMIILNLVDELYFKDSKRGGLIVGIKKIL